MRFQPVDGTALVARFRPLAWFAATFLIIESLVRLALFIKTGANVPNQGTTLAYIFVTGLLYDTVTLTYFVWPLLIYLWIVPSHAGRHRGWHRWLLYIASLLVCMLLGAAGLHFIYGIPHRSLWPLTALFFYFLPLGAFNHASKTGQRLLYIVASLILFAMLLIAAAEWLFWDEFGTRFNFIAVDYLIYTHAVLGNIQESYPLGRWISLILLVTLTVVALTRRGLYTLDDRSHFAGRSLVVAAWLVLTVLVTGAVNAQMKDRYTNPYINALAGNGIYQFFAALRANRLDYPSFYATLPDDKAFAIVRDMLQTPDATYLSSDPTDITRAIHAAGPERHLNVVLISVESLSGEYLAHFGNKEGLTPNIDALAGQGLFFTQLYANGTRTVRGLEALSISVPPTPGDSLLRQPNNQGLFSLADIFNVRGYQSDFVYGGYGYFDNMDDFFSHNGYNAIDRNAVPKDMPIHSENVWGIADEDLYTLAMRRMDASQAQGKPFFLHIMTTSNHRPYTFPKGRIDGAQGDRPSAIKYTDWAIGDFIRRMREKSYFDDTIFVISADHCANSAGKSAIPVNMYHIPLIIYAPKYLPPQHIDRMMAQIDIPPTILGLLNFSYRSRFFGYDIMKLTTGKERAFPATYQKLGFLQKDRLTILSPKQRVEQVWPNFQTGDATSPPHEDAQAIDRAIASYQVAAKLFKEGRMKWQREDATPVQPAESSARP